MGLIDTIAAIFETGSDPVPRYIWYPIAKQESGLDPLSWNPNGEDSRGVFQINLQAHPEYRDLNLFDPEVNARVAMDDFIRPAWVQARTLYTDPGDQAAYVWQHGIRPNWSQVQARGADVELMTEARQLAGQTSSDSGGVGGGAQIGTVSPYPTVPQGGGVLSGEFWTRVGLKASFGLALVLLVIAAAWGVAKAFGADEQIKRGAKALIGGM
jgi:hypothetical protein